MESDDKIEDRLHRRRKAAYFRNYTESLFTLQSAEQRDVIELILQCIDRGDGFQDQGGERGPSTTNESAVSTLGSETKRGLPCTNSASLVPRHSVNYRAPGNEAKTLHASTSNTGWSLRPACCKSASCNQQHRYRTQRLYRRE